MNLIEARVVLQERGLYRIRTDRGEQNALVSGKFQYDALSASDYPVVGDFVLADCTDPQTAVIHRVLPRKSLFVRRAAGTGQAEQAVAANVDTVFLCMSLNNDFSLRRLERYLAVAWESGAQPVVVLTKADLCGNVAQKQLEVESVAVGVPILVVSSTAEDGYAQILPYVTAGRTVAFVGSSGVGKSTLINRLLGGGAPGHGRPAKRRQGPPHHDPPGVAAAAKRRDGHRHAGHARAGHVGRSLGR